MSHKAAVQNLRTGQAGVYRVAAELLLRGFDVYTPVVDTGVDLLVDGIIRIQVKTSSLRHQASVYPQGAYWFKFWQAPIVTGSRNIRKRGARDYSRECEFLLLWGVDEDRFWVVPSAMVGATQCLIIGNRVGYPWIDLPIEQLQREIESGQTIESLAVKYNCSPRTLRRKVSVGTKPTDRRISPIVQQVRECEGRWDLIAANIQTLRRAEVAALLPQEVLV